MKTTSNTTAAKSKEFDILVWLPEQKNYELTGCVGSLNDAKAHAQEVGKRLGGTYFKILPAKGKTLGPFEIQ